MSNLSAVAERDDGLEQHYRRSGGWQVGYYPGSYLADEAPAMLPELAIETDGPALLGFVLDSDAVTVEGFSAEGEYWRGCLARQSAREYWEDEVEEFEETFLTPEEAARKGVQWAQTAGAIANFDQLLEVFRIEQVDYAAELLFWDMLDLLGV